jgi:predicted esterase
LISERHLAVKKTARYCVLGELDSRTSDLWIVCHGFGQLARDFLPSFEPIAKAGRAIVAPEGLSRFYKSQGTMHTRETPVGATWMTSEDRDAEIADYIGYLDTLLTEVRGDMSPDVTVTGLGFSQGVATVTRWVAASSPRLDKLILWGGLLPPEFTETSQLGGLLSQPISFVVGTSDRYFPETIVESEIQRLKGLKVPVSVTRFDGGHEIDPATLRNLAGS